MFSFDPFPPVLVSKLIGIEVVDGFGFSIWGVKIWDVKCKVYITSEVQRVRETLHVFDFNLKENVLRYLDAVFAA